jgi:anti-sigma28 factor (negative regulator of flagellin synthesis)
MRIEQNILTTTTESVQKPSNASTTASTYSLTVSFDESHRLNQALSNTPDVRAEKVARAKAALADPNYPSKEQMKKVATMLASPTSWKQSLMAFRTHL